MSRRAAKFTVLDVSRAMKGVDIVQVRTLRPSRRWTGWEDVSPVEAIHRVSAPQAQVQVRFLTRSGLPI